MTPDMRMGSGSIGKTYVAAVALQLAMSGELDLDAPVSTWLGGEAWFSRVPNHADLTVRNLLNHTAGMIQPYFEDPDFAVRLGEVFRDPDAYMTPEEFIAETVLDAEPLFPAGGGYHYSDVHYTLAGLAIEEATAAPTTISSTSSSSTRSASTSRWRPTGATCPDSRRATRTAARSCTAPRSRSSWTAGSSSIPSRSGRGAAS